MHRQTTTDVQDMERTIHESIRTIHLQLDDLRTAVEQLRQLRERHEYVADYRLMVEHGPNGRPEVVR